VLLIYLLNIYQKNVLAQPRGSKISPKATAIASPPLRESQRADIKNYSRGNIVGGGFHMKTFWQTGRAALARALSKIVSPAVSSASPTPRNASRAAIGRIALAAAAVLLLSVSAAQAQVGGTATTTTLTASPNPAQVNQTVTLTAVVAPAAGPGSPTGSVSFLDLSNGGSLLGSGTLTTVGGQQVATTTTSFTVASTHMIVADYNGDTTFATSQSNQITETVTNGTTNTTTSLTASPNPAQVNQTVTLTAVVAPASGGGSPTGTVTFVDLSNASVLGSSTLTTVGGQQVATLPVSFTAAGTHMIQAQYGGDTNFNSSNSNTITETINNAATNTTTTLTASPTTAQINQQVTLTATVAPQGGSGTPTGTVTFLNLSNGGSTIGSATLTTVNGQQVASITTSFPTAGTDMIQASYTPDANSTGLFNGSTSNTVTVTVSNGATNTTTNLTASPNPVQTNQQVTLTATVAPTSGNGTPTGTVSFVDATAGSNLGSGTLTAVGGHQQVTITASFTGAGTHMIQATYTPDAASTGVFNTSTSNTVNEVVTTQTGTNTTLTSTPNPSAIGQAVTFTATVTATTGTSAPTGTVTFKDGTTTLGTVTLPASGTTSAQVAFTTSALTAGSHSITAAYNGAATFTANTSAALVQNVTNNTSDSIKLREMQVSTTPVIAQARGSTVSSAIGDAITAGLSGGTPEAFSPNGTGFTYYFDGGPATQQSAENDQDSLKRYLASPNGSTNPSQKRVVDDDFAALGYAGAMPTKAPPVVGPAAPREWLAWISVRGTDYFRPTFGDDLKGEQVDMLAGLTRRVTPDFVVGLFAGYETFDYTSQAFDGTLTGDGWTTGAYLGWRLAGSLRFDLGGAWSGLSANDTAGTANGNFTGSRWLTSAGLTGTYNWQSLLTLGAGLRAVGA
jgi:hypothetical protein